MLRAFANTKMNSIAAITSLVDQLFTIKTKGVLALIRKMACMIAAATRMFLSVARKANMEFSEA